MTAGGIRDRFRAQMRQEVKDAALRQLAEGGPGALSLNAIAKELGVSGPALYRYFAGRDALLTALILDAYADLTAALAAAGHRLPDLAAAYRSWAVAHPHRYRLLFGAPLPGYDAHDERLADAAQRALDVLLAGVGPGPQPTPALADDLRGWARRRGADHADPTVALRAVTVWSRLHGLVSLEIEDNFRALGLDPDHVFTAEVEALRSAR
ncbi:TetR/AcrR family transcriptional regulator [Actinoplanes auranticolor]|uniref:TetR family transcriptional regulator n=1 Tax=Actinoplanes auranticolor TaxID=47988 RepID=A0A919SKB4_9ACTN|nr:TetR/AcrR family transcriptional regulator [Actinoplanes auranticolor]GIM73144.1 TetR family transcriptional regulator [Actinoplanes auranticolor]